MVGLRLGRGELSNTNNPIQRPAKLLPARNQAMSLIDGRLAA